MRQVINATQLDEWFNPKKRRAQELLPHLIRNLIIETTKPEDIISPIRIPVGDQVNTPGFDGIVEVMQGNQFVPQGISVWEMGTGDPKDKFDKDFKKRKCDINTTIIFITPHSFQNISNWIEEKKKLKKGKWREIRVYDNAEIELWLELAPNTARWLAKEMGLAVEGMCSAEEYLSAEINAKYAKNISTELIIGGREKSKEQLYQWLETDIPEIRIVGETLEEAASFIAASLCVMPEVMKRNHEARTTFVKGPERLEYFAHIVQKHYVVPLAEDVRKIARALNIDGIRRIVPEARETIANNPNSGIPTIRLETMQRRTIEEHLRKMDIAPEKADRIARESKGSLMALVWMIAVELESPPAWISSKAAMELIPLMLAGQWNPDNQADRDVVAELLPQSGTYEEIEKTIAKWRSPNGPLIQRGSSWDWLAGEFAWARLSKYISKDQLGKFCAVSQKVLGTTNPTIDLEPDKRWAAEIYNVRHPYSGVLRNGLIESIAQCALHNDEILDGRGQFYANRVINDLLGGEKYPLKESWFSLARWLPDLAEAAPDTFLSCIDKFIQDSESVKVMFEEGEPIFSSSRHTYILWALERLAWNEKYLSRVTIALGDLASIDPGGTLRNRPINSLRDIYMPWHVQTTVTHEQRLEAINALYAKHPEYAWNMCISLMPDHNISMNTAEPKWRDWKPGNYKPTVTVRKYWDFIEQLIDRLLRWAGCHEKHWSDLVETYTNIYKQHPVLAERIFTAFKSLGSIITNEEDRYKLSEKIRKILTKHKNYPDAEWSMKNECLEQFETIYHDLLPKSLQKQYVWLFDSWPELPREEKMNYEERYKELQNRRKEAVQQIFNIDGYEGVIKFASMVERPDEIGAALGELLVGDDLELQLLKTLLGKAPIPSEMALMQFGIGYVRSKYKLFGNEWLTTILEKKKIEWSAIKYANVAFALPYNKATWNWVSEWGIDADKSYWSRCNVHCIGEEDVEEAINKLLVYERFYAALYLAGHHARLKRVKSDTISLLPDETLVIVLTEAASHDPQKEGELYGDISYCIEEILEVLESHGEPRTAEFEWMWLPLLEHGRRGVKALQISLATDPRLFVDVLKCIYRGDKEEKIEVTEEHKARASHAYRLLSMWKEVPGIIEHGKSQNKSDIEILFFSGKIDKDKLFSWVEDAQKLAEESGRLDLCNNHIGQIIAYAPTDENGIWPCEPIRELIQKQENEELERGIEIGIINKRGVYGRGNGGEYEHKIAEQFNRYANAVRSRWPRTGAMLDLISKQYEGEAKMEDKRDELEEFN